MSVAPARHPTADLIPIAPRQHCAYYDVVGILYMLSSVGLSFYCVLVMDPYLASDYFWPNFHTLNVSTLVSEIFNVQLALLPMNATAISVALMMPVAAVVDTQTVCAAPSYPRKLLYERLTGLVDAVTGLRHLDADKVASMATLYCWVDLNRRWELAHTSARQLRCERNDFENAAVVLEAVLRNIAFHDWLEVVQNRFAVHVADPIARTPGGAAWVAALRQHEWLSTNDEVDVWRAHGLHRFTLQYTNRIQLGLQESILIENALGTGTWLEVKAIPAATRVPLWTSTYMSMCLANDFDAIGANQSLVRGTFNYFGDIDPTQIEVFDVGYPLSKLFQVVHDQVGPLANIDLKWIAPPSTLVTHLATWRVTLLEYLHANANWSTAMATVGDMTLAPTPQQWARPSLAFYGGNPMCGFGEPLGFVQNAFGFDDACSSQTRFNVPLNAFNGLFAWSALRGDIGAPCALEPTYARATCYATLALLNSTYHELPALPELDASVVAATHALNLSLMQFVGDINGSALRIEELRLLDSDIAFHGWSMVYDWLFNEREAISFQGDVRTLNLLSHVYTCLASPRAKSLSLTWANYLRLCAYVCSGTLALVGGLSLCLFVCLRPRHCHWFLFNRITSAVWLNRGVLGLRSLVATLCLATASVDVHLDSSGLMHFASAPRSVMASTALAAETTWITYLLHDILQPVAGSSRYASISSHLAWLVIAILDVASPIAVTASVHRSCYTVNMDEMIYCASGFVGIGALPRTMTIVSLNVASVLICFGLGHVFLTPEPPPTIGVPNLLLPPALLAFASSRDLRCASGGLALDRTTASMAGLFVFQTSSHRWLFDTKLWLLFYKSDFTLQSSQAAIVLPDGFRHARRGSLQRQASVLGLQRRQHPRLSYVVLAVGFLYLVLSLAGNVMYLDVATTYLANDYGWANFNSSGTRTFLANIFNEQLLVTTSGDLELDAASCGDLDRVYNGSVSSIEWSETLARRELYRRDVPLASIVQGLRDMSPCNLPWMFTQYCWLDFEREYALASTSQRQARCLASQKSNGAAYLEAPLRNLNNWAAFHDCWGASFEFGIASDLASTSSGQAWLVRTTGNSYSVDDEVAFWRASQIDHFTLQWQNFKTVGLLDSLSIVTALGWTFPLSLSASMGSLHLTQQTSRKMYWGFASDLWAVGCNATAIVGASLLASSPRFAFANCTSESLLLSNHTLPAPLTMGLGLLQATLGPFNAIDMQYVQVPARLRAIYGALSALVTELVMSNMTLQTAYWALPVAPSMSGVPLALLSAPNVTTHGGNLLCGDDQPTYTLSYGLDCFFGVQNMCHASFFDSLKPTPRQLLFATLAYSQVFPNTSFQLVCDLDMYKRSVCADNYHAIQTFLKDTGIDAQLGPRLLAAVPDVRSLRIRIIQYLRFQPMAPLQLYQQPLLPMDDDPGWHFYGWSYVFDWMAGLREVVSFQGDESSVTTISSRSSPLTMAPVPGEIPETLSFLFQWCVRYITLVFIALAGLLVVSGVHERGHIEGLNLLELNRIVGHVWVGRFFLLIRSITAFWLLNTSTLQLVQVGAGTRFVSPPLPWYKTVLAGAETTWFVYVLNDVCSCVTLQYTTAYAFKSSLVAWAVAAIWNTVSPQAYVATLHRRCRYVDMDLQLTCESGVVQIGDASRLAMGFLIGLGSVVLCYGLERLWQPHLPPRDVPTTLLNASSYYMLDFSDWVVQDEFYLDKTSALMAGIVAIERYGHLHILDVKSWRYFHVRLSTVTSGKHERIRRAIPLSRL
ncbi:hypothetical protein SPRG_04779 [Saprolegnia parasitica CBS 223.65]|uniref:Uncharacterized protein n=1 Tax=Saprolegnia parasitica (strain CBS 223.65) TaxID=695850 RepID=A0A067CVQ0_SAPPC|nr:hypothetical protein SPRG_04779 [Saprolegnia parasitica CBS 223.65]KDO30877.1 hypothetical protein SPRG_04779 [Saprolegnia parasitica CBS 223.65]|eukprot:XP_012198572.1 hypothetical protein SPRG_04779 [Saprolegnia parasitica CBS 223.65]